MRYKNDFTDKAQQAEQMPITCGSFNSGLTPASYNNWFPKTPTGSMPMGAGPHTHTMPAPLMPLSPMPTGFPTGSTPSPLLPTASVLPSTIPAPGTAGMQGFQGIPGGAGVPGVQGGMQSGVPGASGMHAQPQVPVTVESTLFTPGFLRTQIGRRVKVEFLIGTNSMTDRTGTLVAVGASYIIIRLFESDDLMLCDIYSIKFVTFYL